MTVAAPVEDQFCENFLKLLQKGKNKKSPSLEAIP